MQQTTFAEFETAALARGFDQVLERQWAPLTVLDTHTHPFSVQALVVGGEMWLTVGDDTRHLACGRPLRTRPRGAACRALRCRGRDLLGGPRRHAPAEQV